MQQQNPTLVSNTARLISPEQLPELGIDYCNSHRWRLERDGKFPKRVRLSSNRIAYVRSEIEAYIEQRINAREVA